MERDHFQDSIKEYIKRFLVFLTEIEKQFKSNEYLLENLNTIIKQYLQIKDQYNNKYNKLKQTEEKLIIESMGNF